MNQLIECVPNFSEGRDPSVIRQISAEISAVEGVKLLHIDAGMAANRTVMTFVGAPEAVVEAAFRAIKKAAELINMRQQTGEHPRIGATDVCPLVPISNITLEETTKWARRLAARVGGPLSIPVFLYEAAAQRPERRNLAVIRAGEYEGFQKKMEGKDWQPDFGPTAFNPKTGATVIGARDFLAAYNVNLDTKSVKIANLLASDVRESGRILTDENGQKLIDANGQTLRQAGICKAVKAIGWFIEEYDLAQVSMNVTDLSATPLHIAFEACCQSAEKYAAKVIGSELIGLLPKFVLMDAGTYFLEKKGLSTAVSDAEIMGFAVKTLGLDALKPFNPRERIIEYLLDEEKEDPSVFSSFETKKMKKILLISRHEIILASLLNHLYENGFDSIGALRDAEAVSFLKSFKPDLVILGGRFEDAERTELMAQLIDNQPNAKIINYQGGVKNLLETVNTAFQN
jgi:glutamate formiminotransferase / formiminotetrahydrofolate cyclodeaminase